MAYRNDTARRVTVDMFDPMNLTIEEFDALDEACEPHEFSEGYLWRKQTLLNTLEKRPLIQVPLLECLRSFYAHVYPTQKVAAVMALALCLALPVGAYAAVNHADFFSGAFGDGWRTSQPAQQGTQAVDGKEPVNVVYPASEVVPVDQETADRLLAGAMSDEDLVVTSPDGHELTISHAVRSEYAMVYQFTLHRDGGVTALEWNEVTNNVAVKGAFMPHDQQFSWTAQGDDFLYVDPTASTDDTLVGYGYTVWGEALPAGQSPELLVYTWDVPAVDSEEDQFHMQTLAIPCTQVVESRTFANADGGQVVVSPLDLALDNETGLFPTSVDGEYSMAHDPVWTQAITLHMADGSTYAVLDDGNNLDNTLSACAFWDGNAGSVPTFAMAFNRLVDPAAVESVDVTVWDAAGYEGKKDIVEALTAGELSQKTVTYRAA